MQRTLIIRTGGDFELLIVNAKNTQTDERDIQMKSYNLRYVEQGNQSHRQNDENRKYTVTRKTHHNIKYNNGILF